MRGIIDRARRKGRRSGLFLLLGSASLDLLRQSGETLAGRVAVVELRPLDILEVGRTSALCRFGSAADFRTASWPTDEADSLRWRRDFIRSYLERDVPLFGPRIPAETMRRFWAMLAHRQGSLFNAAEFARSLDVDGKTVARYLDLLVDLLLVRRLPPLHRNAGKRLVKSPKVFIRDSGLVHSLLDIDSEDALLGHPVVGTSWEGFVIETLIGAAPEGTLASFYRTATGVEVDLVLELPGGKVWAIEVKRGQVAKVERGFHLACDDIKPARRLVVYGGNERYPLGNAVEAVGLYDLSTELAALGEGTKPRR